MRASSGRPAHLIGRDEVARWLADSVVKIDRIALRLNPPRGEITTAVAAGIRRELIRLGYDGLVIPDGGDGVDWVIALEDEAVRIVLDW